MNGMAKALDLSKLPMLPRIIGPRKKLSFWTTGLPVILVSLMLMLVLGLFYYAKRKQKFAKVLEDWEHEYGPHRFEYKDLYVATEGFNEKEVLGKGGFGKVYKGVLPISQLEVAVKRVSHGSRQGMKEFIAEL